MAIQNLFHILYSLPAQLAEQILVRENQHHRGPLVANIMTIIIQVE